MLFTSCRFVDGESVGAVAAADMVDALGEVVVLVVVVLVVVVLEVVALEVLALEVLARRILASLQSSI